jgi:SAM-dependent methyltransferase
MALAASAASPPPPVKKMPGHWLLARMGKRVLRPGGRELTQRLLARLAITQADDVVEFAPGLGATARLALACKPASYTAIERDRAAAAVVESLLSGPHQRCTVGTAEQTGLADASATVVYGEAMLSMQPPAAKARIIAEAARLLRAGGRYGIHELCLTPDDVPHEIREAICRELSDDIHVGVRPLTVQEWEKALMSVGFTVIAQEKSAMHLLEHARLIRDEGFLRAIRFVWNVAWHGQARRRVLAMRRVFRKYRQHLAAVALVAVKPEEPQ